MEEDLFSGGEALSLEVFGHCELHVLCINCFDFIAFLGIEYTHKDLKANYVSRYISKLSV